MIVCKVCKLSLSKGLFYKQNKSICKNCLKMKKRSPRFVEYMRKYAKRNRVRRNRQQKEYRHRVGISKKRKTVCSTVIKNGKDYTVNWHKIRKIIYKRDNWTCQECGCKCHNTTKRKIQCHHIDYDTQNNNPNNLITLCASCHAKTNFNRGDWKKYYKKKVGGNRV